MSQLPAYDESIPVLTEVVAEAAEVVAEPAALPVPAPDAVYPSAVAVDAEVTVPADAEALSETAAPATPPTADVDDGAWQALEERLVARVLDRLQDRVGLTLEDQIRSSLAPVLEHVVTRLAAELRDGLQHTVEQVVARAVAQELAHLKSRNA